MIEIDNTLCLIIFVVGSYLMGNALLGTFRDTWADKIAATLFGVIIWIALIVFAFLSLLLFIFIRIKIFNIPFV